MLITFFAVCVCVCLSGYVLLWVQSAVSSSHHPSIFILKQLLTLFNNKYTTIPEMTPQSTAPTLCLAGRCRYESNLDAFLVLHAGVLFRSIFALCRPVMSQHLWSATTYVESVQVGSCGRGPWA